MSSGLGLDLGAGLTKLARASAGDGHGRASVAPVRLAHTAVAYRGLSARIPSAGPGSRRDAGAPGDIRHDGFPAVLAGESARQPAADGRTPAQVAHEFLRLFLGAEATPAALAAAVPPGGAGELEAILAGLGGASPRLLPTPVAILLYLRHSRPEVAPITRFIVGDLGASSVTMSLCTVTGYRTRVVDFARVAGTSRGEADTRDYADVGGRVPLLIEGLALALTGQAAGQDPAGRAVAVRRWRELEDALGSDEQRARLDAVLDEAMADPARHGGTVALRVGGAAVSAASLLAACAPTADRCAMELTRLLRRQGDPAWLRSGTATTRVVLAGGLAVLRPVRAALLAAAGLDPSAPGAGAIELSDAERLYAAAFGAALVSAGLAEPGDRYPYGLRLPVHRLVRDRLVTSHLELATAGSIAFDLADPVYAQDGGTNVQVLIRPTASASGTGPDRPIPLEVVMAGRDTAGPAAFCPAPAPPPGRYHVGVRGDPSGAALVLQPVDGGELLSYPLAEHQVAPQAADSG